MKTSQWRRVVENMCIFTFSARLNELSDRSSDCSAGGSRFNVAGPLTVKLCCPVAVRACKTSRVHLYEGRSINKLQNSIILLVF